MEELNKTQLILLALLVSFVTSTATGIVTVTLMDQAPPGVTQTITRVIRQTERIIVPAKSQGIAAVQTIIVKEEDYIIEAVEKNSGNVVEVGYLKEKSKLFGIVKTEDGEREFISLGTGFAISRDGYVIVSENTLEDIGTTNSLLIKSQNGNFFELELKTHDSDHELMLFQSGNNININVDNATTTDEQTEKSVNFSSVEFVPANSVKIGQTAIALGIVDESVRLKLGTISGLDKDVIYTTVSLNEQFVGGPLLNNDGDVVGINIVIDGEYLTMPAHIIQELLNQAIKVPDGDTPTEALD